MNHNSNVVLLSDELNRAFKLPRVVDAPSTTNLPKSIGLLLSLAILKSLILVSKLLRYKFYNLQLLKWRELCHFDHTRRDNERFQEATRRNFIAIIFPTLFINFLRVLDMQRQKAELLKGLVAISNLN